MVKYCFVPECTTGNTLYVKQQKASGLRNKSLFKAPKVRNQKKCMLFMKKHFPI